jgi:hypothetical protein
MLRRRVANAAPIAEMTAATTVVIAATVEMIAAVAIRIAEATKIVALAATSKIADPILHARPKRAKRNFCFLASPLQNIATGHHSHRPRLPLSSRNTSNLGLNATSRSPA